MTGFTFNNVTSQSMGVNWLSTDRTVLPAKRINRYIIPGKDGYYESDEQTYDNRTITGVVTIAETTHTLEALRAKARLIAQWLAGKGQLIFDDETGKAYTAKVVSGISIEQLARSGNCQIQFDCAPFAESVNYNQQQTLAAALPHTETVAVTGTQEAPCLIYITAKSNITNMTIKRVTET